jgi:TP901 family phage tail tape measure protein
MAAPIQLNANLQLNPASINASAKQVQQALGRITGQASEFQKSLDASTARVFAFGATTTIINGVTQSFKKLVSTTITVEAKLKEINSILGAGAAEFNNYRNAIFQVAKNTGQAFSTVADGAAELARQGLSATESAKRLENALILTRISGLSAEQSVKALTAAMNGFTSAGLNSTQVINKIVAVDTAFAVSAQDLADGFSRAGSTAEDAGVKFEELLALITAVEQRTARGGAVIGNAFKSIFTRLSRGTTIGKLQELGVAIDAGQNGVQKLKALSDALDGIADPSKASAIKELAGGVFQINVVSAALKDIGNEASVFGEATATAFNATNEATEKNAQLNDTLLAKINELTVSVTSFAEKLGSITFGPLLTNIVGIATTLSDSLDSALDPEKGNAFVQGLFKVIGSFLSGPGLAVFSVAFFKIFKTVIKFAKEGFSTIMKMGSAAEKISQIEGGVVSLLQKDEALRKTIASTTNSQATKEKAIIDAIKRENQLLAQQQQLVSNIANIARQSGVTGFSSSTGSFTGKKGKRYSSGGNGIMEPNLMTAMANEAKAAPRGATPFVTNFRGSPAVMNSSEMQVRINGREEILRDDQIPRFNDSSLRKKKFKNAKKPFETKNYAYLVPQVGVTGILPPMSHEGSNFAGGAPIRGLQTKALKGISDNSEANVEGQIEKSLFGAASNWTKKLMPLGKRASYNDVQKGFNSTGGAAGALAASIGSAFEIAIAKSLNYTAASREKGGDFDVRGGVNIGNIQKLFGISQTIADFKVSQSRENRASFANKIKKESRAGVQSGDEKKANARKDGIKRDRKRNPQFYTADGKLKRGLGNEDAQNKRLAKSKGFFDRVYGLGNASLRGRGKKKFYAKGSLPNLKIRRFNDGSMGDMMGGMDPMMMMMMFGGGMGMGGMGGGGGGGGENSNADFAAEVAQRKKANKKTAKRVVRLRHEKQFGPSFGTRLKNSAPVRGLKNTGRFMKNAGVGLKGKAFSAAGGLGKAGKGVANVTGLSKVARGVKSLGRGPVGFGPAMIGAVAGQGISALGDNMLQNEDGSSKGRNAGGTFTKTMGNATSMAATGAAVAGPLGALVGGLAGLGKSLYDAHQYADEAEKLAAEQNKITDAKNRAVKQTVAMEQDILGKRMNGADMSSALSSGAKETNMPILANIGPALIGAKKALKGLQEGTTEFTQASEKYEDALLAADMALKNVDHFTKLNTSLQNYRKEIDNLIKNNAGVKLGNKLNEFSAENDIRKAVLNGMPDSPFKDRAMANSQALDVDLTVGKERAAIMDLQTKLAAASGEERLELKEQLKEASVDFKETVLQGALKINALRQQAEAKLAQKMKQRSALKSNISNSAFAGIINNEKRGTPMSIGRGQDIASKLNAAVKSGNVSNFQGLITSLAKEFGSIFTNNSEKLLDILGFKMVGDSQGAQRNRAFRDEANKVGTLGIDSGPLGDKIMGLTETGKAKVELDSLNLEIEGLKGTVSDLGTSLSNFGKKFNAEAITTSIDTMTTDMQTAAKDVKAGQAQIKKIADVASDVTDLLSQAETITERESARMAFLIEASDNIKDQQARFEKSINERLGK